MEDEASMAGLDKSGDKRGHERKDIKSMLFILPSNFFWECDPKIVKIIIFSKILIFFMFGIFVYSIYSTKVDG